MLKTIKHCEFYGEAEMLEGGRRSSGARALDFTTALKLYRDDFAHFVNKHYPAFVDKLRKFSLHRHEVDLNLPPPGSELAGGQIKGMDLGDRPNLALSVEQLFHKRSSSRNKADKANKASAVSPESSRSANGGPGVSFSNYLARHGGDINPETPSWARAARREEEESKAAGGGVGSTTTMNPIGSGSGTSENKSADHPESLAFRIVHYLTKPRAAAAGQAGQTDLVEQGGGVEVEVDPNDEEL